MLSHIEVLLHLGLCSRFVWEAMHLRIFVYGCLVVQLWLLNIAALDTILGHASEERIQNIQLA